MPIYVLIALATIAGMELVAYLTHRYLMHGPLWSLHRSHHEPREGAFEKNDLFGVFFALPSIVLIYFGRGGENPVLLAIGIGMAAYGAIYFLFHDVLVHRRIDHGARPRRGYLARIVRAHHIHHSVHTREGAVSFGFLYAPPIDKLKRRAATGTESVGSRTATR